MLSSFISFAGTVLQYIAFVNKSPFGCHSSVEVECAVSVYAEFSCTFCQTGDETLAIFIQ